MSIFSWGSPRDNLGKIDSLATDGLAGTEDSLAYRVHEIERHLHNNEEWYGKDSGDTYLNRDSITPWQLTAGTGEAYGTEVQISDGTEIEGGDSSKKFDIHRLFIQSTSVNDQNYKVQVWAGTGTFAQSTLLSEVPFRIAANQTESQPIALITRRVPCDCKIWLRCKCATNGATIDLLIGLHTYSG
jgi:hypothetical protein